AVESDTPAHPPQQHDGIQLVRPWVTEGPACSPFPEQIDDALQLASGTGEAILGRLPARTPTPFQHARSLKPPQPLRQKRPRHPGKAALQLVETTDVRKEFADDEHRPTVGQDFCRARHRTVLTVKIHECSLSRRKRESSPIFVLAPRPQAPTMLP